VPHGFLPRFQTAAAIGTEVPVLLLQAIAELPEAALHRGMEHLQAAEFLYETRLFPEQVCTFKHALTHEVAYGGLLHERRRLLHARIMEALEKMVGDRVTEQVERLAYHALRGEVWDKAVVYARQVGTKALAPLAYREAVAGFDQALLALGHLPKSRDTLAQAIDLRCDLRIPLNPLREDARILDCLREAETLAEALGDQDRLGRVSAYMAQYCWGIGDYEHALAAAQRALALATTHGDSDLQINAHLFLALIFYAQGHYYQAMAFLRKNVVALAGPRPFSLAQAYFGMGFLYLRRGDLHHAIPMLERSLGLCQAWDISAVFPRAASALGAAYALSERFGEALLLLQQAVEQGVSMRFMVDRVLQIAWLSEGYVLTGRLEDACALADRARDLAGVHREQGHEAWVLRLLGEIAAHRAPPDIDQAAAHYRQALALADELGMRPLQAHMYAVEFQAKIKNGTIEIPEVYRSRLKERVRVILLAEEESTTGNLIDQLLQHPLTVAGFKPFTRDEIYERS
jgi:tetratricopeptide (TPR) repeat protein